MSMINFIKILWLVPAAFISIATMLERFCVVEEVLAKVSQIRSGAEHIAGISRQRFIDKLTWMKFLLHFNLVSVSQRRTFERVCHALETLKLDDSNGTIRKQPYCILLTGKPGCGKSRFALQAAIACLKSKYGCATPGDLVTLNETDEFQSEFRTSHKVVIFDDLGAERVTATSKNPWRKIIDFVNNVRKTSLNPNVEMKGNVYIEPDLVIITTNLRGTLDTYFYLNAPGAIFRRLSKIIYLEEGFKTGRIMEVKVDSSKDFKPNSFDVHHELSTSETVNLDRSVLIDDIVKDFDNHMAKQEEFVRETNQLFDRVEERTIASAFYNDIIYPLIPKKAFLSEEMEKLLSWDQRLLRRFAVVDKTTINLAVAQGNFCSSLYETKSYPSAYVPQSSVVEIPQSQPHVDYKLIRFLVDRVDWQYYELAIRKIILPDLKSNVELFADCFCLHNSVHYSWKPLSKDPNHYGLSVKGYDLERAYELWLCENEFSQIKIQLSSDEEMLVDDLSIVKNDDIDSLLVPDALMRGRMNLDKPLDPNMVEIVKSMPKGLRFVGREVNLSKKTADLIFRYSKGDILIYFIAEVKSNLNIHRTTLQALDYCASFRRIFGKDYPCIAVAFNNYDCNMQITKRDTRLPKFDIIIPIAKQLWFDWRQNYLGRCGAAGPNV